MRRTTGVVSGLAALALVAACSSGTPVDVDGADDTGGGEAPAQEQLLRVAIGGEPDQLDPNKTTSYFAFEVLENVFDTLVETDANLEMQPALAESWEVSDDQLTWTFTLREGVTFHDGSDFTGEDVVYSYNRIMDEELANAWKFTAIESVDAPDEATVVITLSQPTPNLLSNLGGFKGMAIVNQDNVESGDITTQPVGTGPFSVTDYVSGDHISLSANPDYWGGAPQVEGVRFEFISEPATALAALRAGEIHWTDVVPPQDVDQLEGDEEVELGVVPSSDYWYLTLNEEHEPWGDARARQALAYAIDREAIIQAVSYGTAVENQLAIPEQSIWYVDYDAYSTDLDKAEELLDEVGYEGGTLDLMATSDYPETVTAAQIIAANLEPLGIDVQIRQLDFSAWLDDQNSGDFDMLMMGWLGNIDPDDFYYAQHHTGAASNAQGYSNSEVDDLLDDARVETDQDTRYDLYAQAAQIIADEASYIYLYNPAVIQAWSPDLTDYEVLPDRAIRFRSVSMSGS